MSLQKIYDRSPVAIQNVMVTVSGYQRNRSRYGRTYWEHRRWLEEFDTWSLDRKREFQNDELRRFVAAAATASPFYRDLYANLALGDLKTVKDIALLPVVDKETLRANMESIYTVPRKGAVEGHTGGTTGKSLVILMTRQDLMKRMAMLDHFKSRVGFVHRKMRRATFNGKHIVPPGGDAGVLWRYNAACKQMIYSSFHLTERNLGRYVESLNRFQPHALDGFFASMLEVAGYIERHEIPLTFRPIGIFPTSETVTAAGRAILERVFGCRVYNQYASSEGAPFVTECSEGTLHCEMSSGVFEQLGEEILVTSFTTHGTPLIRYRIGDTMSFGERLDCACGIASTTVASISGRNDDFVYRADGARVNGGNIANLFKNMPNALIRAQVRQRVLNEVHILLEVDKGRYLARYDDLLRAEFNHKFGPDTRLVITHVEDIPRASSGKHRLIVNELTKGGGNDVRSDLTERA